MNHLNKSWLILIFLVSGCAKYRVFMFTSSSKIVLAKGTTQRNIIKGSRRYGRDIYKLRKADNIIELDTYILPKEISDTSFATVSPYIDSIQSRNYTSNEYLSNKRVIKINDTLTKVEFAFPFTKDGYNRYYFNKMQKTITFIRVGSYMGGGL